jgi:hypothetical protein
VYKARDTRLDRSVAIKILRSEISADPERRLRFEREAKTVAGLSHPHICTLYDVGDHAGSMYLVMEHQTGETLAERLQKGPLPLAQALTIAIEDRLPDPTGGGPLTSWTSTRTALAAKGRILAAATSRGPHRAPV